jgi:tetratricopeptide (TPR) repeat protein
MKRTIIIALLISITGVFALHLLRRSAEPIPRLSQPPPSSDSTPMMAGAASPAPERGPMRSSVAARTVAPVSVAPAAVPAGGSDLSAMTVQHSIDKLCSPQTAFQQKQEIWQQLRDSGKLDQAIAELEQRTRDNPANADAPANLGQAYLQKAGSIQDLREQGILGMKADQVFDTALSADPTNWDARFWKATAMSYWPAVLGKSKEVMQQCVTLIEQQENQAPQPHYLQSYLLLGEQYKKGGYAADAKDIWLRGQRYFPNDPSLKEKLASLQ